MSEAAKARASAPALRVAVTWTPGAQAALKGLEARGLAAGARRQWNAALKLGARACVANVAARGAASQWARLQQNGPWAVDATFVCDEEMRELNARYRSKNRATDVLSFSQAESAPLDPALLDPALLDPKPEGAAASAELSDEVQWPGAAFSEASGAGEAALGDIVIAVETAQRQAGERAHTGQVEVLFLAIHGTLHLLGYDHQSSSQRRAMWHEQEALFDRLRAQVERAQPAQPAK